MKSVEDIEAKGVHLTKTERKIASVLMENYVNENKGKAVHYDTIVREVWEYERYDEWLGATMRSTMSRLNSKLKKVGIEIRNRNSFGYYLMEWKKPRKKKKIKEEEVIEILY